jgi:hypothetical protein
MNADETQIAPRQPPPRKNTRIVLQIKQQAQSLSNLIKRRDFYRAHYFN